MPDFVLLEPLLQRLLQQGKRNIYHIGGANHKNQIYPLLDMRIMQAHGFAYPTLGPVALHGFADSLADHKPAPCMFAPIVEHGKAQQAMHI